TNWNSASFGSKCQSRISDVAKVMIVVQSATQRALRFSASPSPPRSNRMNSAPTSGRKVTTERTGQLMALPQPCAFPKPGFHFSGAWLVLPREREPSDEGSRADQHGEGIVIEITGLQPHHVAGDVEHARRNAVRPEAVDQPAVAALPEQAAEPER